MKEVIEHYNKLIDENNDPARDPKPLRDYMDKWDGQRFIESMQLDKSKAVLEIGVGTGRIAVKVAPNCKSLCGIDVSEKALSVAKENALTYKNVSFINRDFTTPSWTDNLGSFDIIVSNPPYIPTEDLKNLSKETLCDPILALDGGKDGLNPYRIFSKTLLPLCHKDTYIFFEIGQGQETDVQNLMSKNFTFKQAFKDLSGITRILCFSV